MHTQSIRQPVNHTQANNGLNTTAIFEARQRSFDIEGCAHDGIILIDALFRSIDTMVDVPSDLMETVNAINCFATCAKRNLALIVEANQAFLALTAEVGAPS